MTFEEACAHLELGDMLVITLKDVHAQYRRMAMHWHPDRNNDPRSTERMKLLNIAFEIAKQYVGPNGYSRGFDRGEPHSPRDDDAADAAQDFSQNWSWQSGRYGFYEHPKGRDVRRKVSISLYEAVFGFKREFSGEVSDACEACLGHKYAGMASSCPRCHGVGSILYRASSYARSTRMVCPDCDGSGHYQPYCKSCGGSGLNPTKRQWSFSVKFKPGRQDGEFITLRGEGGRSADPNRHGDLIVEIKIKDHPLFYFDENRQLCVEVPVSVWTWLSGGEVVAPLLDGAKVMKIEAGEMSILVPGEGVVTKEGAQRGYLLVHLSVRYPSGLDEESRSLLYRLRLKHKDPQLDLWEREMQRWTFGSTAERFGSIKEKQPKRQARSGGASKG